MYVEDCKAALDQLGPRLAQIYGQGETPMTITVLPKRLLANRQHPRWEERLSTVGYAATPVEIRIAGEDGAAGTSEVGEILVRGDTVMSGYWNMPAASAETLRGGWLHTGDVGSLDAEGFLTLRDRAKDVIISGGSNIYPREVEEVLLRCPQVCEASVVGRPHPDWGEEVVAFVVPEPGQTVSAEQLGTLCNSHIARFKRPKVYRFVTALPKNEYGKVLKSQLRTWAKGSANPCAANGLLQSLERTGRFTT
jgi:long-chain acyl-CoA synthetase